MSGQWRPGQRDAVIEVARRRGMIAPEANSSALAPRGTPSDAAPATLDGDAEPADAFQGPEKQLSAMVCADLRRRRVAISVPRGDRESTVQKGWPDLTCLFQGRGCCIELKVSGGKLSDFQRQCHADLRAAGVPVLVAWNFDAAIAFARAQLGC